MTQREATSDLRSSEWRSQQLKAAPNFEFRHTRMQVARCYNCKAIHRLYELLVVRGFSHEIPSLQLGCSRSPLTRRSQKWAFAGNERRSLLNKVDSSDGDSDCEFALVVVAGVVGDNDASVASWRQGARQILSNGDS
jgi:hypothetical protein